MSDPSADPSGEHEMSDDISAPVAALSRVRAAATARGLRPGRKPRRGTGKTTTPTRTGRDPLLLTDEIQGLLADRGWNVDVSAGAVMGRWPQVVGPQVADHCTPVTFEGGVLVVQAESTTWATQLRLMSSTLMARIEESVGPQVVTDLKIVGPAAPSWKRGPRRISDGRGPRDTYG